ncbi:MAG: hypothetical protein MUC36_05640 [Planctomycetes bacterium]|jgi:hypothetical protein|nr:hypothetical protein [Planctomycetota bacterium]
MTIAGPALPFVLTMLGPAVAIATCQASPGAADQRTARIYDVQRVLDRIGPGFVTPGPAESRGVAKVDPLATQKPVLESVAAMVRAFVRPELAADEEVRALGERWLAVVARGEQHAWIEQCVATTLAAQPPLGRLQVEVLTMPEPAFARDVAAALTPVGKVAAEVTVLPAGPAASFFVERLRAHPEASVLPVPMPEAGVVLQKLVPCSIAAVQQTAYVRDFEVEVATTSFTCEPIVDVVQDGFTLRATAAPGTAGLGLALHAEWAELMRPIPTSTTTLEGSIAPVTVQLPQVRKVQVEATVELPADSTVVVLLPALLGKRCIAVLRMAPAAADREKVLGR